jgi:hypothetical protein
MHTVYRLYNCICTLHLFIAVVVLLFGLHGSFYYLEITKNSVVINNSTLLHTSYSVLRSKITLSAAYFIACISASLYSMVYLSLFSDNNSNNSTSAFYYNFHPNNTLTDDESNSTVVSHHNQSMFMLSEMGFWGFLVAYSFIAIASNTLELGTMELLYIRLLLHLFCIYTIILGSPQMYMIDKKVDIVSSIAFMTFIGETFIVISVAGTQVNLVMAYFHRFLDCLMVLGHRWDTNPCCEIILNCRLFYMAMGGLLLHADILLTSKAGSEIAQL